MTGTEGVLEYPTSNFKPEVVLSVLKSVKVLGKLGGVGHWKIMLDN